MENTPKMLEERRKVALDQLVRKYLESREREEELRRRLEGYGRVKRWVYKTGAKFRRTCGFVKEVFIKPAFMGIFGVSGLLSATLAVTIMPRAGLLIERFVPFPFNYITIFLLATCIAFSPFIISLELYRYREIKREKKILREEYGISV